MLARLKSAPALTLAQHPDTELDELRAELANTNMWHNMRQLASDVQELKLKNARDVQELTRKNAQLTGDVQELTRKNAQLAGDVQELTRKNAQLAGENTQLKARVTQLEQIHLCAILCLVEHFSIEGSVALPANPE
eukprot:TRINITY_DN399_c0_g1_i5.p3 TRINITY_DN399_c0_g1~~TRINITY_DN399_c0_g1_i5.p3  ORF type:complete len:136 (-),score=51.87 TRINITY_DN399_c0_g1_i5:50-457(-)